VIAPVASTRSASAPDPSLKKAAEGFEAVFLRQVIGSMRQAKLGEDLFGSAATDTYRELSDKQMADNLASTGSLGIAALVEAQLSRKGEVR